jgi:alkylhydroperoxidase family enzyme
VKTVGALVAVIGSALALASRRRQLAPEIVVVAAGSAAALATIDTVYVVKRRISPVYLLDAVAEIALVAGWARLWSRGSSDSTGDSRQR